MLKKIYTYRKRTPIIGFIILLVVGWLVWLVDKFHKTVQVMKYNIIIEIWRFFFVCCFCAFFLCKRHKKVYSEGLVGKARGRPRGLGLERHGRIPAIICMYGVCIRILRTD